MAICPATPSCKTCNSPLQGQSAGGSWIIKDSRSTGVKVQVTNCDYLDMSGKEEKQSFREFRDAVGQAVVQMPEQMQAISDDAGRFELNSIPEGIVCRLHVASGIWEVGPLHGEHNRPTG